MVENGDESSLPNVFFPEWTIVTALLCFLAKQMEFCPLLKGWQS